MAGFPCGCLPDGAICRTSPVPGRSGSQARPAVRRVIPSQAGGWWRAVRAWPTGLAAMMRRCRRDSHHVCCLLIRDGRWACLGRATGHGPRARWCRTGGRIAGQGPAGKASDLNAASLAVSRRGDQILPAAKAGSCISGGACGAGAPQEIMPGTGSSRSLPAG
jgi:hypothetical protein